MAYFQSYDLFLNPKSRKIHTKTHTFPFCLIRNYNLELPSHPNFHLPYNCPSFSSKSISKYLFLEYIYSKFWARLWEYTYFDSEWTNTTFYQNKLFYKKCNLKVTSKESRVGDFSKISLKITVFSFLLEKTPDQKPKFAMNSDSIVFA